MKRLIILSTVALLTLLGGASIVLADEAVVTRDSDVYRSRTSNRVVDEVERGQLVEVYRCSSSRCQIDLDGDDEPDGWVRINRLAAVERGGRPRPDIPFRFGITIGPGGPGVSIDIGGSDDSGISIDAGSGPQRGPRVCLFEHENYGGAQRCFAEGDRVNNLSRLGWNDVASSVRVHRGAQARLCEHANGGGACHTISSNQPTLGGFNDKASYIDVF
ncbi:MAG TPA: peptidase inhibitor family I36 protein [Alphaproteobacteria bacterium]|nr:peptidase inhibitor family I36 protein [Alphaproteobacteria bacterium]